jgi:hypothetical protein
MMNGNMLQVTVPANCGPGQMLHVQTPGGGRVISAIVPEGHGPGQMFYVRPPPPPPVVSINNQAPASAPSTDDGFASGFDGNGQSQSHSSQHPRPSKQQAAQQQLPKTYKRCSEEMLLLHNKGLVKVKVPKGLKAGDRFKLSIPDGRTINAVVPPGNVSEFHLKVPPKKQNWHDNPLAVAPMTFGPFF